jgi:hypothetical protein
MVKDCFDGQDDVPIERMSQHSINPTIVYVVFRDSRKRQIKAQFAAKAHSIRCAHGAGPGYSISKSCNAELTLSWSPYLLKSDKIGQCVSVPADHFSGTCFSATKVAF